MKKYGYLESGTADSDAWYKESAITDAVKTLQEFGNIPVTGQLDNATLELMASPRCGIPDIVRRKEDPQRKKRHTVKTQNRKKRDITYFIAKPTPKLGEETVVTEIEKAFDMWNGYSRLNFKRIHNKNANIFIVFNTVPHDDESEVKNEINKPY
ncbi:PREDICTED: matrix metalloproteinase-24-like isoform X2 [Eufriesea mexicana]|nr:PREDICTED: matrix metalloproteinase-24-like isoform X2 [Eufriesea mexicana]